MTARMQEAQARSAEGRPILIRLEAKAGHGAGKPMSRLADELSDELAFLFDALGCISPLPKEAGPRLLSKRSAQAADRSQPKESR
jgi:prolyl oligopeptidase